MTTKCDQCGAVDPDDIHTCTPVAQPAVPDFKAFKAWANDAGYDTAYTHDGIKWICLNPMTADLWKAWQAATTPAQPAAPVQPVDFETWFASEDRLKDAPKDDYPITYLGMEKLAKDSMRYAWNAAHGITKGQP